MLISARPNNIDLSPLNAVHGNEINEKIKKIFILSIALLISAGWLYLGSKWVVDRNKQNDPDAYPPIEVPIVITAMSFSPFALGLTYIFCKKYLKWPWREEILN